VTSRFVDPRSRSGSICLLGFARVVAVVTIAIVFLEDSRAVAGDNVDLRVDASVVTMGNPRFWTASIGTGTAGLALRADLQTQYKIAHRELGIQRVRGHGVLSDLDIYGSGTDGATYDWTKFDTYLDAIVSAGMRPIMELSFMPPGLADGRSCPVLGPPRSMYMYAQFVRAVVQHCVDKYGMLDVSQWYWEVWNEPEYSGFWSGSMDEYYVLYGAAVRAASSVIPNILIGGPAATCTDTIGGFLQYCKREGVRVTFVSSHFYPGGAGGPTANAEDVVKDNDARRRQIESAGYTTATVKSFNTEWNSSYAGQGGRQGDSLFSLDNHWNAGFILKSVKLLSDQNQNDTPPLDVFSYWALSDIFDEWGGFGKEDSKSYMASHGGTLPFGQVFGLMTYQGLRKASFNAFKMLDHLGPKRLRSAGGSTGDGVDVMATTSATGDELQVLVYNYFAALETSGSDEVALTVANLPQALAGNDVFVTHFRVDESHSNPHTVWANQGSPSSPTEEQWQGMRRAQHLALYEDVVKTTVDDSFSIHFSLPRQAASMILVGLQRPRIGRDAFTELEAEDYDGQSGVTREDGNDTGLGQSVSVERGSSLFFDPVDFSDTGAVAVQLRVKTEGDVALDLRATSPSGPLLGQCVVNGTGGGWVTRTCKLTRIPEGVGALHLVFGGRMHVNWLRFDRAEMAAGGAGPSSVETTSLGWGRVVDDGLVVSGDPRGAAGCTCWIGGDRKPDGIPLLVAVAVATIATCRKRSPSTRNRLQNGRKGSVLMLVPRAPKRRYLACVLILASAAAGGCSNGGHGDGGVAHDGAGAVADLADGPLARTTPDANTAETSPGDARSGDAIADLPPRDAARTDAPTTDAPSSDARPGDAPVADALALDTGPESCPFGDQQIHDTAYGLATTLRICLVSAVPRTLRYRVTTPALPAGGGYVVVSFRKVPTSIQIAAEIVPANTLYPLDTFQTADFAGHDFDTWFAAAASATFFIDVSNDYSSFTTISQTFDMSATFVPIDDAYEPNDLRTTAASIPVGTPITATPFAGYTSKSSSSLFMYDYYKVTVPAGIVKITLTGGVTSTTGWKSCQSARKSAT
jgi:xylan 1,4-beta-xylosidase